MENKYSDIERIQQDSNSIDAVKVEILDDFEELNDTFGVEDKKVMIIFEDDEPNRQDVPVPLDTEDTVMRTYSVDIKFENENANNPGRRHGRGRGRTRGTAPRGSGQGHWGASGHSTTPLHAIAGPSTRTFEEEHALLGKSILATRRTLSKLEPVIKEPKTHKRAKDLSRSLLPDAPPRKRARKETAKGFEEQGVQLSRPPPSRSSRVVQAQDKCVSPVSGRSEDTLYQIRAERQATQRRMAALTTDARRGLVARQREGHLERMLLPDAPPRKRQTKRTSPERQTCIMVERCVDEASTSRVPHSSVLKPAGPAKVVASTSGGARFSVDEAAPGLLKKMDIAAPGVVGTSSSSDPVILGASEIAVHDEDHGGVMKEWLRLTEIADSDDDLNDDDDLVPTVQENIAATEPACETDFTEFQAEVLRREDDVNDRAIRDIVPDDCYTFVWNKDRTSFVGQREKFTGTSGPTFDVTDQTRAIDVFDRTIDVDFIDLLCRETNRNAEQKIALLRKQNKLGLHSRFNRWSPTDRNEMVSFLAIIILQGLYPLPEEEAYFKYNGFGTMPYFAKIMSYNRFLLLKSFLHFVDNKTCQDTTRLCKIRPVIDYFNFKFSSLYMPSQEIVIDESLLKWKGRLSFAQKISSKAAQVGIKTYELCESSSGYLWKFFVYTGKDKPTTTDSTDRRTAETNDRSVGDEVIDRCTDDESNDRLMTADHPTSATAKIVYDLIEPLLHRGHTVIMDNFYNSPLLLRTLKKQKTDCYGTLRLNREFVPDSVKTLTKTELRRGEVVATYCSDLAILVWRDANIVSLISTYHNLQIGTQDKYNRLTYKPCIVLDYNKNMGGVDRKDQFLSAQPVERQRNKMWYKKLFRRLYNTAIFNCFVIYSSFDQKISHRRFRTVLAEELLIRHKQIDLTTEYRLFNYRSSASGKVTTTTTVPRRNLRHKTQARAIVDSNHFPIRTGSRYTCCAVCPKKTRTIWKCEECDVNLCVDVCFKAYHKP